MKNSDHIPTKIKELKSASDFSGYKRSHDMYIEDETGKKRYHSSAQTLYIPNQTQIRKDS